MDPHAREPNRLAREQSPYLLQHAYNPVDWHPWGEEAFAKARREQKPIFLSIGYSTCHWCHVMERESFERDDIAGLLNESFVSIKVDREEHPDLDQVYMHAVTAMTGQGGWPLTVFLTPDLKPFFGGTYFPPEQRGRMAGMKELLPAVAHAWDSRRAEITASADELTSRVSQALNRPAAPGPLSAETFDRAYRGAAESFDADHGGFGDAPKFPRPHELSFLLRYWSRSGTARALEMVTTTLDHIARGGIHDHVGGGFHRYSIDAQWRIPHFEKMLYDQALLARAYLEAHQATRRADYAGIARRALDYVLRDLTDGRGGFYSAEDADSEGEEGAFYVWSREEILTHLGPEEGERFARRYGVSAEGNFEHGKSVLHLETAVAHEDGDAASRERLFSARSRRPRPHRDDKVLTSWNGLMVTAFAIGGALLDEPRYLEAARKAARFILDHAVRDGILVRRWRAGEARYPGTLEDYAYFAEGLLALYEATFDAAWLAEARRWTLALVERFWDEAVGALHLRSQQDEPLIVRATDAYDGATPSGSSVASLLLLRMGRLTGDERLEAFGRRSVERVAGLLAQTPLAFPAMLAAADEALGPTQEIVIAGTPEAPDTQAMTRAVRGCYLPRAVTLFHPEGPGAAAVEALVPRISAQRVQGGRATAYVCERFTCAQPTTDIAQFTGQLQAAQHASAAGG
jgi:uncharacterized protein YyaL (SSP411 family)